MKSFVWFVAVAAILVSCTEKKGETDEKKPVTPSAFVHFDSSSQVIAQPLQAMPDALGEAKVKARMIYRTPEALTGKTKTILWFRELYNEEGKLTLVEHFETENRLFLKKELEYNNKGKVALIRNYYRDDTNKVEFRYQDDLLLDKTVVAKDGSRILYQYQYQDTFTLQENVTTPDGKLFERSQYKYSLGGALLEVLKLDGTTGVPRKTEYVYNENGYKTEEIISEPDTGTTFVKIQEIKFNYDESNRLQRDRSTNYLTGERVYNYYRFNEAGKIDRKRTNVVLGDNQLTTIEEYQYNAQGLLQKIAINRDVKGQRILYEYEL